jgi:hypothetical protein
MDATSVVTYIGIAIAGIALTASIDQISCSIQ